ncbi:MAG: cytochrome c biogenesis protein ResB [Candidatus Aminicenantia bacterium]
MKKIGIGKSVLVILVIGFLVNILQLIYLKFLNKIPSLLFIVFLVLLGLLLSLLKFSKIVDYLKSIRFSVALLIVITISIIIGTFIVQEQNQEFYRLNYGGFSFLIFFFFFDSLYKSWWFNSFLLILSLSLTICTLTRKKLNWRELGFYMTHLGIVVILIGALIGDIFGVKGFLDLHIGERKGEINIIERGMKTTNTKPLGFDVELANFSIEEYIPEYRLILWKLSEKTGKFSAVLSVKPEDRKKVKLSDGTIFFIKEYYPDFYIAEKVLRGNEEGLKPVMKLSLQKMNSEEEILLYSEKSSYFSPDGEFAIYFRWDVDERLENNISFSSPKWRNILEITVDGKTLDTEVEKGDTIERDGYTFKVIDFLPHFIYDSQKKEAFSFSEEPKNPALRVEIRGKNGEVEKIWIFGKVSGFERVVLFNGNVELKYRFEEGSIGAKRYIFIYGGKKFLKIIEENGSKIEGFSTPHSISFNSTSIKIEEIYNNASVVSEYSTKSNNPSNPAILLHLEKGTPSENLLLAHNPEPIYLGNGNFALTFERKMEEIKDYKSKLRFIAGGKVFEEAEIEVNKPYKFNGFFFYQSNYDPKDLTYSGIEVVKDPGINLVWLGFLMLSLGIVHSFFIKGKLIKTTTEE